MKNKIFALIAVTLFSLSSFAQMQSINTNNNQQQTNNGKKTLQLSDLNLKGGGTKADPYLLTYPEDLFALSDFCAQGGGYLLRGHYFKLTRNIIFDTTSAADTISLDGYNNLKSNFIPIGGVCKRDTTLNGRTGKYYPSINDSNYTFRGTLDGCGYHISGLRILRDTSTCQDGNNDASKAELRYSGLFGRLGNTIIKNLTISNGIFTGYRCVGPFAGTIYNDKKITNESLKDTIYHCASVNNRVFAVGEGGGFIGSCGTDVALNSCYFYACYSTSIVKKLDENCGTKYKGRLGPIYGKLEKDTNTTTSVWTIKDCIFYDSSWYYDTRTKNDENKNVNTIAPQWAKPSSFMNNSDSLLHYLNSLTVVVASLGNEGEKWVSDYPEPFQMNDGLPMPAPIPTTYTVTSSHPVIYTTSVSPRPTTIAVEPGGSFINGTSDVFQGITEKDMIVKKWNVYGRCLDDDNVLVSVLNDNISERHTELDMVAVAWNYEKNNWDGTYNGNDVTLNYLRTTDNIEKGKSMLVYPLATTYNSTTNTWGTADADISIYTRVRAEGTLLNNAADKEFSFKSTATETTNNGASGATSGYWAMVANPYPATLDIAKFITTNKTNIQGNGVYIIDPKYGDETTNKFKLVSTGDIPLCNGFAISLPANNTEYNYTFSKTQLKEYTTSKSQPISILKPISEMLTIVTKTDDRIEDEAYFNINEIADNDFDINDAFVMPSSIEGMVSPYFLIGQKHILKDEVKTLPYQTGFNFHSSKTQNVDIFCKNIPTGVEVTLLDTINKTQQSLNDNNVIHLIVNEGENNNQYVIKFSGKVSIEDEANKEEDFNIAIYPNPAMDYTTMRVQGLTTNAKVMISDVEGRVVKTYSMNKGQESLRIETSGLSSGIYNVRIITEKAIRSEMLIVK